MKGKMEMMFLSQMTSRSVEFSQKFSLVYLCSLLRLVFFFISFHPRLHTFLFLLNSVVNATFCDDQSASSMKGCFARIWELVFTRNNSKLFFKIFRQISNFAKIILPLLVVALNACILLTYFHAFLLSTEFRHWFHWLIRNSLPVLDLKAVTTAWGYHCHCCSNTLRRIFLWVAQAD